MPIHCKFSANPCKPVPLNFLVIDRICCIWNYFLLFVIKGSLERELLSRSSPDSPTYLKWMTFAQVNTMTSNPAGAKAIVNFLLKSNINITSILPHHNYIRASASVSTWESLLQAKFYIFDDRSHKNQSAKSYVRAHRCLMLLWIRVPYNSDIDIS